jgi:HJR/Mrr/RecB family endonuclease
MGIGTQGISTTGISASSLSVSFDDQKRRSVVEVVKLFSLKLVERAHKQPEILKAFSSRVFEEFVAELWSGFGYDVELTKKTRDSGRDIIAIRRREAQVRYLIECKRSLTNKAVSVGVVRELFGVLEDDGTTKAFLPTTGYFSGEALEFFERNKWRLEPADYDAVCDWIKLYIDSKYS